MRVLSPKMPCASFALLVALWPGVAGAAAAPLNLYVSTDGSDQFSGRLARNNRQRADGPFLTVAHARDIARAMLRASGGRRERPINIVLRGGTYFLGQPLLLGPEDSGTADCPVTYAAYPGERPVLSAGRPVRGWAQATINGRPAWAAAVPQLKGQPEAFRELWVNGKRRVLARSPNEGFFRVAGVPAAATRAAAEQGQKRFEFHEQDLANLHDLSEAEVVLMSLWAESHLPVASVDAKEHSVEFTRPSVMRISPDDRYFIEGSADLLDTPGEWTFDRKSGTLYYLPLPGEAMGGAEVIIPWHEQIVRLEGDAATGQFVHHVTFRGITFANSEWSVPRDQGASGFAQAAVGVPGAVWGQGVRDCTFDSCAVVHAGNYGIELAGGCQHNKITYCTFTDLGAGGIKLGEGRIHLADAQQTKLNEISDCTIADCGKTFPSAVGIWIGQSPQNVIAHNDIHGLWYTGISIGWTWGYGDSLAGNNVVEFNHVHHIGSPADGVEPILSDMGAIYTLGNHAGTVVRNNHFHDIAGLRYGGWGIYLDEGTSKLLAENNLVYRTTHGGFHQHYGADNIVRNNIFAFGRDAQIQRTRVEDHLSFTFEKNLVYWDRGALLAGDWHKANAVFDHNTYWHAGGKEFDFAGKSWEQWRQAGMDAHSQIADPGFEDPLHGNFQIKDGAAKLAGFVPFDLSAAGPRPRQDAR